MIIISRLLVLFSLGLIYIYQYCISPFLPKVCRFYPTCSHYAVGSFSRFGFIKGVLLTLRRISRCHPYSIGGYDPVPETNKE
ncbi:MAG: membrane protein insertion efficiency factor YidD [Desulfovibrionaceae bacterium]